jgi:tellurite resistance protein
MGLAELLPAERIALISLARVVIRSDGAISEREAAAMSQIASGMGPAAFVQALREAEASVPNTEATRELAATIDRPEGRRLIYRVLHATAAADGLSEAEAAELGWLAGLWELPADPETLALPLGL